ncbi:hypothetical protein SNEBB_008219 [Seison nebaliae]|nr:hypothetical protein SNEBB_008219 [Seison nebaliae]
MLRNCFAFGCCGVTDEDEGFDHIEQQLNWRQVQSKLDGNPPKKIKWLKSKNTFANRLAIGTKLGMVYLIDDEKCLTCQGPNADEITAIGGELFYDLLATAGRDLNINIWNIQQMMEADPNIPVFRKPAQSIPNAHEQPITTLQFVTTFSLFSGSRDGSIKKWNINTGKIITEIRIERNLITDMIFSPLTNMLIQSSEDQRIRLFGAKSLDLLYEFPRRPYIVKCLDVTYDGTFILAGYHGTNIGYGADIRLFDITRREEIKAFVGHQQTVVGVKFIYGSEDPLHNLGDNVLLYRALSAANDNTIKLWDLREKNLLITVPINMLTRSIAKPVSIDLSIDHKLAICLQDEMVHIVKLNMKELNDIERLTCYDKFLN